MIKDNENIFEFFYNLSFPAKPWQDSASIYGEEQNKKTHNLQIISLMLCQLY